MSLRRSAPLAPVAVVVITAAVGVSPAAAAPSSTLEAAVSQMRGATSCPPLHPDPVAQQTAELSIHSTDVYLDHTARAVPMADPLPTLKDLGSSATRAYLLQGAGLNEADAVKFILISGFNVIPDCGYSQFGVATAYNEASGYYLASAVLVGG